MSEPDPNQQFEALMAEIGSGVPDAAQYRLMSGLVLDIPQARQLAATDPFLPEYRARAMQLYLGLRDRPEQGYDALRDEPPATPPPADLWTGLVPWSFGDAAMASEHLLAWGHVLSRLGLPKGGSVLEYGPGSGQILLCLARLGYRACGVDIDDTALGSIRAQAAHLGLPVETEQAEFGGGFEGERFDCILFYEAFHHAFEFERLLARLHERLRPGGRVVLCGEPIVAEPMGSVPYPWGPRLDALSVFCIRRFGWMELGFTQAYFRDMAELAGWEVEFHPYPGCGRAEIHVLRPADRKAAAAAAETVLRRRLQAMEQELAAERAQVAALHASTSWRLTAPLRGAGALLGKVRRK